MASCAIHLPQPEVEIPSRYIYDLNEAASTSDGAWWHIYNDPVLDSLQRRALAANRDLAAAAERVEQARLSIAVARSAFLPNLNFNIAADLQHTTPIGTEQQYTVGPSISWDLSLFGALRYAQREARAELLSSEWALRGVQLSLTVEMAKAYFTLRQSELSLSIARRSHHLREESAALIDSLFHYGMATGLDADQARSLVYVAASDIEQYTRSRNEAQLSICTLLGIPPQPYTEPAITPLMAELPSAPPEALPSELLQLRPDIMQAHYTVEAAAARVGTARSNRFPSIPLSGSGGRFGAKFKELFSENLWSWSATASLVQPLFSFGRLSRREQIARSAYDESLRQYEQTVLEALEQVESALTTISTTNRQTESYAEYVAANERIAYLTEQLYRIGMSNYLDVISTEQTWYTSQLTLIELMIQQRINYSTLVMALGEGWQGL